MLAAVLPLPALFLAPHSLQAQSGTWNVDNGGNWSDTSRWVGGTVADGVGSTANFVFNITATRTVTLDSSRSITALVFTDATTASNDWALAASNNSVLTLAGTNPTISATNRAATISAPIAGTVDWANIGANTVVLTGNNTFTGVLTVSNGILRAGSANALGSGTSIIVQNNENPTAANTNSLQLAGGFAFGAGKTLTLRNNSTTNIANARAAFDNQAGNNSWEGAIVVDQGQNQTLQASAGVLTINGNVGVSATPPIAIFIRGTASGVFNGNLNLGTTNLLKTDSGTWTINSTGNTHGTAIVANGTVVVNNNDALAPATNVTFGEANANTGTLTVNAGFTQTAGNVTVASGSTTTAGHRLNGAGSIDLGATQRTFTINDSTAVNDLTISVPLLGSGGFVKTGAGLLALQNVTVSGPVSINAGTLVPGSATTPGSITAPALSFPAATVSTLAVNLGTGGDSITVTGANGLTLDGTTTVNFTQYGAALAPGNHLIINYSGTVQGAGLAALSLGVLPPRMSASLFDTGSAIALKVTANDSLTWTGATNATWDINTTPNWNLTAGATQTNYLEGDVVIFGNSGANPSVTIAAAVNPSWINFANDSGGPAWRLSGAAINGTGGITKTGTGTATLAAATGLTGPVLIQGGTLEIDHDTGSLTATTGVDIAPGATLALTHDGSANIAAFSRVITGSGTIRVNPHSVAGDTAARESSLTGNNSGFSGTVILEAALSGSSRLSGTPPTALGSAAILVENENQFYAQNTTYGNPITITGDGYNDTLGSIGALRFDGGTLNGTVTVTGTAGNSGGSAYDARIGSNSGTTLLNGPISGGDVSFWSYSTSTPAIYLTAPNSYGDTIIGGTDNVANGGAITVVVGDNAAIPANTTATLGSGNVYLVAGNNATNAHDAVLRIRRADGYTLGQDVLGSGTVSADLASTRLEADTLGTGLSLGGRTVDLSDGTSGGTVAVAESTDGAILNLDNGSLVECGSFHLGETGALSGTVNQAAGTTVNVINQVRVGHWPTETSTWNMSGGSLNLTTATPGTTPSGTGEQNGGIYVGIDGTGVFNQSGGTVSTNWVVLDNRGDTAAGLNMPTGIDQYNLSGGTLELKAATGIIARNATTEFNFSGGTIRNTGSGVNVNIDCQLTVSNSPLLDINGTANAVTLARGLAGSGTLTAQGGGTLILNGISTFTGTLAIADATVLSGTGTFPGTVNAKSVSPGATTATAVAGTLTLGDAATPTTTTLAGTVTFDLNALDTFSGNDFIDIKGNADFTNTKILPRFYGGDVLPGTYVLFQYSGTRTGTPVFDPSFVPAGFRQTFTIQTTTPGLIELVVAGAAANLTWVGDGSANVWDVNGAGNWNAGNKFFQLDTVTINDSGSNTPAIALSGVLQPAALTVNNSTKNFTFTGSGSIGGGSSLAKDGTGQLTLLTNNTYSGVTDVFAGILQVGNGGTSGSIGTGLTTYDFGSELRFNRSDTVTLGNVLAGTGTLVQQGSGTLVLGGANTMSGPIRVDAGVLVPAHVSAFGTASDLTVASGAQVNLNGTAFGNTRSYNYTVAGSGPDGRGVIVNDTGAPSANAAIVNLTLTGNSTFGAYGGTLPVGNRFDIGYNGAVAGTIEGGGFTFTKVGDAMVNVRGAANNISYVVAEGTLRAETNDLALGSTGVTINAGARLDSYGARTFSVPVTLAGSATLSSSNSTGIWNGAISESVAGSQLTLDGGAGITLGAANTYTGGTLVRTADVTPTHNSAFGPGTVTIDSPVNNARITLANGITVNNPLVLNASVGTAGRGLLQGPTGGTGTWSGPITINGGPTAGGIFSGAGAGAVLKITGPITSTVNIGHRDYTLELSGGGSYPGITSTNTLLIGAHNGIATNAVVTLGGSAACTFDLSGFNQTLAGLVKGGSAGTATNSSATLSVLTLDLAAGTSTNACVLTGNLKLVKSGPGELALSVATSTFTGDVAIDGGQLTATAGHNDTNPTSALGNPGIGSRSIAVNTGATLALAANDVFGNATSSPITPIIVNAGGTLTNSAFNSVGPVTLNGGTMTATGGGSAGYQSYRLFGNVTVGGTGPSTMSASGGFPGYHLGGSSTFTVADATGDVAADLVVSAPLVNQSTGQGGAAGALVKAGPGTLALSAANSYTGTTNVNGGTLRVDGSLASSVTTVASGATLSGGGSLSGSVTANGTIAPGTSIGTLATGSASFGTTGSLAIEINSSTLTADKLAITGDLTIDPAATLTLADLGAGTPALSTKLVLVTYSGTWTGTVPFAGKANNSTVTVGANSYTLKYDDTDGGLNAVTLTASGGASAYDSWASSYGLTGANLLKTADPDQDGAANLLEFATDSSPVSGSSGARVYPLLHSLGGQRVLTLTLATRKSAVFAAAGAKQSATKDGVVYTVEGSDNLSAWNSVVVSELTGADAAAVQAALGGKLTTPPLGADWEWHSFRTDGDAPGDPSDFIRLGVAEAP